MAKAQFLALGDEEFARRPHHARRDRGLQRVDMLDIGHQRARFEQRGQHGDVGGRLGALRDRTHRVTDRQARVPQQREEAATSIGVALLGLRVGQHQQVDVRLRKQFAAAVAADREQCQRRIGVDAVATRPCAPAHPSQRCVRAAGDRCRHWLRHRTAAPARRRPGSVRCGSRAPGPSRPAPGATRHAPPSRSRRHRGRS